MKTDNAIIVAFAACAAAAPGSLNLPRQTPLVDCNGKVEGEYYCNSSDAGDTIYACTGNVLVIISTCAPFTCTEHDGTATC